MGRIGLTTIAGSLDGWVGGDLLVLPAGVSGDIVSLFVAVTDAPSGGSLSLRLGNAAAGGGDGIAAVIADGTNSKFEAGAIPLTGVEDVYLNVTAASGGAMNLSGWFELVEPTALPLAGAFTTLGRVKEHAGIAVATATWDTLLTNLIGGVTAKMQNWMKREILTSVQTAEKLSGNGFTPHLFVEHYPIQTGQTFTLTGPDAAVVLASEYEIDALAGVIVRVTNGVASAWDKGVRNYALAYTGGYASTPNDLVAAATEQVRFEFMQTQPSARDRLGDLAKQTSTGGVVTYERFQLLPSVLEAMRPYRRR